MQFGGIVMTMEFKLQTSPLAGRGIVTLLVAGLLGLAASPLAAETYRWKDKNGEVHYGAAVPAEYADQPYDILNDAGLVIERVEDTSVPMEVIEEQKEKKKRQPLISEEIRREQADKLLVLQYDSEEDITRALEMEVSQLGYDSRLIDQSFESTAKAIRDQIRVAADQQRANMPVNEEQKKEIAALYLRRKQDEKRLKAIAERERNIRERFQAKLERYRFLTSKNKSPEPEQADQG